MGNLWYCYLVRSYFLFHLICRCFHFLCNFIAFCHMFVELLEFLISSASWTRKHNHVENLRHIVMKSLRSSFTTTITYRTLPPELKFLTFLAEQKIAIWAFDWIRCDNVFAELANELIYGRVHPRRFIYVNRTCFKHILKL